MQYYENNLSISKVQKGIKLAISIVHTTIAVVHIKFSIAVVRTKVINAVVQIKVINRNSANKSFFLQDVHTKAIAALTQFCDF